MPKKRGIWTQDPFCVVTMNGEDKRTKTIQGGGQDPVWDEEIRFTIREYVEDEVGREVGDIFLPITRPRHADIFP